MRDTEFIAEVVRIASVKPHPNADRLEVVQFDTLDGPTAYTCVTGKGQFTLGDQAGYVGVDSTVPLLDPRWEFLRKRLDAKGDRYRIKAAKLRGVYSEGILMEVDEDQVLGDQLAERWDIAYYQVPDARPTAPGTQTGPSKIKDHTLGGLFPIYGVDSLRKVPWLFKEGDEVVYTEKIHGTNFRAGLLGIGFFGNQRFVLGSHRVVKHTGKGFFGRLLDRVLRRVPNSWYGEDVWADAAVRAGVEDRMRKLGLRNVVLYGELYGRTETGAKIQDLTYGGGTLQLRLFDAYDAETGTWHTWPELLGLCHALGLEHVPVLAGCGFEYDDKIVRHAAEGQSTLADHIREGVVVRGKYDARRGKYVGEGYRMREGG